MNKMLSILLVEDDEKTCNEFNEYIDAADDISLIGITNNSTKAIEIIKDFIPDAIILDLELHNGQGNGLILLQELKNLLLDTYPYILITTNNSSPITYDLARKLGADFIMSKHQADYSVVNVINFLRIMKPVIYDRIRFPSAMHSTNELPETKKKRIIQRICSELNQIGVSPKLIGYQYLIDAIQLVINQPMQNLCNTIGEKYAKTDVSVERAMQNAINKAWRTSDIDDLLRYYTVKISSEKGVPTITEFVFYYANKIRNEY
ncbi:MAG: hypothetical protein K0R00_1766 [Herbinix sp.]|jgi:DNA-binding NarL/FixJ family response regulator|nr:hypothetical protein [Herbinix sp.]